MVDGLIARRSYQALADHMAKGGPRPERLLLLGDQVYVDATYGLLDPGRLDDQYRMPYEDLRDRDAGPLSALPMEFVARIRSTPDDHEFIDNWEPWSHVVDSERFRMGLRAFWQHQRRQPGKGDRGVDLEERHLGWRLFMADTRTERTYRNTRTLQHARIMSERQEALLQDCLAADPADDLKIVTSAAMLLPRSREYMEEPLYLDNWQGYPASFHRLLAFLCDRQVRNVVFLSGDAHFACSARVQVQNLASGRSVEFQSHHAPAFYAPYPFANESRYNLLLHEAFEFTIEWNGARTTYGCEVCTDVIDEGHDGCGLLTATRAGASWSTAMTVLRPAPAAAAR